MNYFELSEKNESSTQPFKQRRSDVRGFDAFRSSSRIRTAVNLTRCPTIPFSSPAGLMLAKKSKMMTEESQQERLDRIERHVSAPILTEKNKHKWCTKLNAYERWTVNYRSNRDKTSRPRKYVHLYNFGVCSGKPGK